MQKTKLAVTLPVTIKKHTESFSVVDAADRTVSYHYFSTRPDHARAAHRFLEADALANAQFIARALTDALDSQSD